MLKEEKNPIGHPLPLSPTSVVLTNGSGVLVQADIAKTPRTSGEDAPSAGLPGIGRRRGPFASGP
jgi:hypothetical protein